MDDCLKPTMRGELTTGKDGKKHFVYGKTRLNVTEHFAKTFSEILDEIILKRAQELKESAA